jgi:hypothetical protein
MRYSLLASLLVVAGIPAALAEEAKVNRTVYLNNVVLEELKKSKPRHYAQAMRVMNASDSLCAPGAMQTWKVLNLPPSHCTGEILKTSHPPKRQITFFVDDIRYIVLVTLKDSRPAFQPAHQDDGRVVPAR